MSFLLSFLDIILWLTSTSIILLMTSELVSSHYSQINLLINKSRHRRVALALDVLFLLIVLIHILGMGLTRALRK